MTTVLGSICYWSRPSTLHLHLPLRDLPEEREGAAGNCDEELWPPSGSYREVSGGVLFQLTRMQSYTFYAYLYKNVFSVSGNSTWRSRSTSAQQFMATLVVTSFRGRCPRSWNTDTPCPPSSSNLPAGFRFTILNMFVYLPPFFFLPPLHPPHTHTQPRHHRWKDALSLPVGKVHNKRQQQYSRCQDMKFNREHNLQNTSRFEQCFQLLFIFVLPAHRMMVV